MSGPDEASVLERIRSLGVSDPLRPSAREIKLVLDAFIKKREIDKETFSAYLGHLDHTLTVLFDGLKQFSRDSASVSQSVLEVIKQAMEILGKELERSPEKEERAEIRQHIANLIVEARQEADAHRRFGEKALAVAAGVTVIAVGVVIIVVSRGRNKEVLAQGLKTLGGAMR